MCFQTWLMQHFKKHMHNSYISWCVLLCLSLTGVYCIFYILLLILRARHRGLRYSHCLLQQLPTRWIEHRRLNEVEEERLQRDVQIIMRKMIIWAPCTDHGCLDTQSFFYSHLNDFFLPCERLWITKTWNEMKLQMWELKLAGSVS